MLCPHCQSVFDDRNERGEVNFSTADLTVATLTHWRCPACKNFTLGYRRTRTSHTPEAPLVEARLIYPRGSGRRPSPPEVEAYDPELASDYNEACDVLLISPQASAALGRRCLQHILRFHLDAEGKNLAAEIEIAKNSNRLRPGIIRQMSAVRHIGNSGAHPMTDSAGEILPVTMAEAEWTLDTIQDLLHDLFVEVVAEYDRTVALNLKLSDAQRLELPDLPRSRDAASLPKNDGA